MKSWGKKKKRIESFRVKRHLKVDWEIFCLINWYFPQEIGFTEKTI